MLQIAVELTAHDSVYEPLAVKFFEHFVWIGSALGRMGDRQDDLWDEEDGFFYDVLRLPDGSAQRLKVRSIVGLLPLCAATVLEPEEIARIPNAIERAMPFWRASPIWPSISRYRPSQPLTAAGCWQCSMRGVCAECYTGCSTRRNS